METGKLLLEVPTLLGKSNDELNDSMLGRLLLSEIDSETTLESDEVLGA